MKFYGLFVGIDRYASHGISWLNCAGNDAKAMHALISDTLGAGAELLIDASATRVAVQKQFERLAATSPDDVVMVYFSGHGSDTHELVTYDADPKNLANTGIPLHLLTEWFSRIPASRLVCVLDCCFSGGMGAKVLTAELKPKDVSSVESKLDHLGGAGRLILTASSATEPAWESGKFGHGLLTHHLLEALQGAPEVQRAGQLPIYPLLQYVTTRVVDSSGSLGKNGKVLPSEVQSMGSFRGRCFSRAPFSVLRFQGELRQGQSRI